MEPISESDSSDQVFPQTPTIRRNRSRRNNFQDQFQDSTENRDPERKIIIVGYPFTGSKTLTSALSILGYRCADETTHFTDHLEFWYKIANCTQQDPNIFKRMYEDYDVISGAPLIYFWEYILKCFPKSKIIFLNKEQDRWIDEATEMFNDYFYSYEHLALSCNLIFPNWLIKKFCRRLYVILAVTRWNFNQLLGPFNCDCNLMTGDLAAYIFLVFFQRCNWVENFNQIENLNSTSNSDNESPRNSQNEGGKNNNSNNNNSKKILINYLNSFKKPNLSKMLLLKKYTEHNQYINYIMPQCSEMANFFEMAKGIKQNGKNFLMKFCAFRHFFKVFQHFFFNKLIS